MYGINIFGNIKMPLDWYIVYYGIKNNILSIDTAQEYACRKMEKNEQMSEEEVELSWKTDNLLDVIDLIERIPGIQDDLEKNIQIAKDKIRIAIILYLRKSEMDTAKLFEQIDMIYADFDYPEDMEKFISYMPINDEYVPTEHSLEENRNYLLCKLDSFINEQVKKYQLDII